MPHTIGDRIDVQALLIANLSTLDGVNGVETKVPANLAVSLPFIRVMRIGGADDFDDDSARVDIDTFDVEEPDAYALAQRVWHALYGLYGQVYAGRRIDTVGVVMAPIWADWADNNINRYVGTYDINSRII